MALPCFVNIVAHDAQGRDTSFKWRVPDADYGTTDLPSSAQILAVVNAVFGDTKLSNSIIEAVQIMLVDESFAGGGGDGSSASAIALRARSAIGDANEFLLSWGGADEANLVFDPENPNAVSGSTALWTAVRTALTAATVAISAPTGAYSAVASGDLFQAISLFNGRRGPMRPR